MSIEAIERELANVSGVAQDTAKAIDDLKKSLAQRNNGFPVLAGAKVLDFDRVSRAEANVIKASVDETRAQLAGLADNVKDLAGSINSLRKTVEMMALDDGDWASE